MTNLNNLTNFHYMRLDFDRLFLLDTFFQTIHIRYESFDFISMELEFRCFLPTYKCDSGLELNSTHNFTPLSRKTDVHSTVSTSIISFHYSNFFQPMKLKTIIFIMSQKKTLQYCLLLFKNNNTTSNLYPTE